MSKPVTINVPHSLGKEEARRRIDVGFVLIQRQMTTGLLGLLSFQQNWEGDRLNFECGALGQRITGRLDVLSDSVQIQIDLPDLLAAIAERITGTLKNETRKLLEKK